MNREQTIELQPIGVVRNGMANREDDHWGAVESDIELDSEQFGEEALAGLEAFSHIEVVFHFHLLEPADERTGARHPRGNPDWPLVGIFAQRGSPRPNRIGVTRCRLLGVEGLRIRVSGLDALDGTPVLDIKPWFREFAPKEQVHQPAWVNEVMGEYWNMRLAE